MRAQKSRIQRVREVGRGKGGVRTGFSNTTCNLIPHLGDKWGAHASSLLSAELALGQGHTLRSNAEKLGAGPVDYREMCEVADRQVQHTEVVAQGGSRAPKQDGTLPAEHPRGESLQSPKARG